MPAEWIADPTKITVIGLLAVFIGALLSTRFYTKQHHLDVVKELEERAVRAERDADFWKTYALRMDEKQERVIDAQEQQLKIIAALRPPEKAGP